MEKIKDYQLKSNDWAVPPGIMGIGAVLCGFLSYLFWKIFPEHTVAFTNIMFLVVLVLLTFFYRKIYTCELTVQEVNHTFIKITWHKYFIPQTKEIPLEEISEMGLDSTKGVNGLVKIPEKHWLYLKWGRKKYYFYETNTNKKVKKIQFQVRSYNPQIKFIPNFLKKKKK